MKALSITFIAMTLLLFARASLAQGERSTSDKPLKVCATLPDLGDIVRSIGGNNVDVTVFVKGPEDPHFLEAKPSFIKSPSNALPTAGALPLVFGRGLRRTEPTVRYTVLCICDSFPKNPQASVSLTLKL